MSCHKKSGKDGHDGHKGEHGPRGERGKRGHRGHIGFPGGTGPTGPCCTGPTGSASPCASLFARVTEKVQVTSADFEDIPLCLSFTLTQPGGVDILVSLSAQMFVEEPGAITSVVYQVYIDDGTGSVPIFGSKAASRARRTNDNALPESLAGNSIVLHENLPPGTYTVCVLWRVEGEGQSAIIDPEDGLSHGSLIVQSCVGLTPTEP